MGESMPPGANATACADGQDEGRCQIQQQPSRRPYRRDEQVLVRHKTAEVARWSCPATALATRKQETKRLQPHMLFVWQLRWKVATSPMPKSLRRSCNVGYEVSGDLSRGIRRRRVHEQVTSFNEVTLAALG